MWVAAADRRDQFSGPSRSFLEALAKHRVRVAVPAIARLEVACALARRLQDAERARALADRLRRHPLIAEYRLDASLMSRAVELGTSAFLRGADALYAAVARLEGAELVSWDAVLSERAGARTSTEWLAAMVPPR